MKYATTKNYRNRMKQFLVLALMLLGANMAWGQASGPWTPDGSGTYRLRSRDTTGNNFDVYKDGTNLVYFCFQMQKY